MFSSYTSPGVGTKSFSLVQNAFLQAEGLPFGEVLPEEEIRAAFTAENACFAEAPEAILAETQHVGIATSRVGHRPNRVEPRAIKRRPKAHKLLSKPRQEAREDLLQGART